jgi:hydroxypyruvate isomerase
MPRLAANLDFLFTDRPLSARIDAAAACGFTAVEMQFPERMPTAELGRRLQDAGLDVALINMPVDDWDRGGRGCAALPGAHDRFRDALDDGLARAGAIGARRLHVLAGVMPRDVPVPLARASYMAALRHAADAAGAAGIGITIEAINPRDMPGYFLSDPDEAAAIVREIDHPALGLQFDLYHTQITRGDLTRRLDRDADIIAHVQIAGVPDRSEPDRGEIAPGHLLDHLDRLGYDGWVGLEYRPCARTEDGLGWAARWGIHG